MHHPVSMAFDYMNSLSPEDRSAVGRWSVRMGAVCAALALLVFAAVANPQARMSGATAAEPAGQTQCALRDLRIVTAIEAHGAAQDVPATRLADAFFTLMNARAACAAGRTDEALAIYDSIAVATPVARTGSLTLRCAERDLRASNVIEQFGEIAEMPPAWLAQAGLTWLQARGQCLSGAEREGVALYDRIIAGDVRLSIVSTVNEQVGR
jgi:hypothetical protein